MIGIPRHEIGTPLTPRVKIEYGTGFMLPFYT
jgi:hypothetical protein